MRPHRALILVALLVVANSANAQQHHQQPHNAPAQQGHQAPNHHVITPEMHNNMMMNQMYNGMMMDLMFEIQRQEMQRNYRANMLRRQPAPGPAPKSPPQTSLGGTASLAQGNQSEPGRARPSRSGSQTPGRSAGSAQPGPKSMAEQGKLRSGPQKNEEREKRTALEHEERERRGENHKDAAARLRNRSAELARRDKEDLAAAQTALVHMKSAQRQLEEAYHDYQEHRVKAMQHNESGMLELGSPAGAAMGAPLSISSSQQQSDHRLSTARHFLHLAQTALRARTVRPEHHRRAEASIAAAINEIDLALSVK